MRRTKSFRIIPPALLGSLVLLCVATAAAVAATRHDVIATTFQFIPPDITVDRGDTVRWVWDFGTHTVTEGVDCLVDDPLFNAELGPATPTFEYVFNDAGRVDYFCQPHCIFMDMKGSVTVRPSSISDRFYQAQLDGEQMVPPVETDAFGHFQAYLSSGEDLLHVQLVVENLTNPMTASHIHLGGPGETGPQIFDLGIFEDSLAKDIVVPPAYLTPLKEGGLYVAVHTEPYPVGEIRGQIEVAPAFTLQAPLKPKPPIESDGVGFAEVTLWGDSSRVHVDLYVAELTGTVTSSHIHEAPPGEDGPIVFDLGVFEDRLVKDLAVNPAQAQTMLDGGYYINVHTSIFLFGEVRGQIGIQTPASVDPPLGPSERASIPIHVMPVPTSGPIEAHFRLPSAEEVRAEIYGPDGRVLRRFSLAGHEGTNTLTWDGTLDGAGSVPTGVYFLSIHAGGDGGRSRILVLR